MSNNHTAILTDNGYVITLGSNNEFQLGHNENVPNIVKDTKDKIVTVSMYIIIFILLIIFKYVRVKNV